MTTEIKNGLKTGWFFMSALLAAVAIVLTIALRFWGLWSVMGTLLGVVAGMLMSYSLKEAYHPVRGVFVWLPTVVVFTFFVGLLYTSLILHLIGLGLDTVGQTFAPYD